MKTVSRNVVVDAIKATNGQMFTVVFKKRSDGTIRRMNCRLGVKKYLKGGKSTTQGANVLTVFDVTKGGYRSIPIEGIIQVRCNGTTFEVKDLS